MGVGPGVGGHGPVEHHEDDGAVGPQERHVLQLAAAAAPGDAQPNALGALGDEFTAGAERDGDGGGGVAGSPHRRTPGAARSPT